MQKKRSLMFRLMTAVNISAMIILITMTSFILTKTTSEVESLTKEEIHVLLGSIRFTLADYVKNTDLKNLQTLAADIVEDEIINEVFIYDKDKKILATAKTKNAKVIAQTTKFYEEKVDIVKLGEEKAGAVGSVVIKYNHNKITDVKKEFYMIGGIAIIISQLLLAFVMWFALSKSIKAINSTTAKLNELSLSTSNSSKEVESISEEVSSSANEQASSIQETVATLDEITSQVTTTVESVNNSNKKSEESLVIANEGKIVVNEMIHSMESIGQSNKEVMDEIARGNERIGGIVKIITEISQKTKVINDIVFQTKLLSFNASVEAARAGEHGKGFSVVAEEIGKLALVSGTASTEIATILSDSIVKVNSVIEETNKNVQKLTNEGNDKVTSGMKIATRCGVVLEDVVTNATIVKNMMNEISVASKEQAEGVRNIAAARNQLDQATLNNNKAAAMSSENAKRLSQLSTSLQFAVVELEKEIFGGIKTTEAPAAIKVVEKKVEIKKSTPKKDNVLPLVAKKETPSPSPVIAKKVESNPPIVATKASGSTPAYNDPRFEDV